MNIMEIIPHVKPASVDDIIVYESDLGPWSTKSGGLMHVVLAFPKAILETMLNVDDDELKRARRGQRRRRSPKHHCGCERRGPEPVHAALPVCLRANS